MKFILYFLSAFFICLKADAQIETCQLSLRDSTRNILYIGMSNSVRIQHLPAGAKMTLKNGTVQADGSSFMFYERKPGLDTLTIHKGGKIIFRKAFEGRYVCDPAVRLCGIHDSVGYPAQILACPDLIVSDSCIYKNQFHITSFRVATIRNGQTTYSGEVWSGHTLPALILEEVKKMKRGDKILFENITGVFPDDRLRSLPTYTVYIR